MKSEFTDVDALDRRIGIRIRHVRKVRGLTLAELGKAIGVSFQQIQKYERGRNRISTSSLILLARALDVAPGALLADKRPNASTPNGTLLAEDGAHEFIEAMGQIHSPRRRHIVVELARRLAAPGDGD